MIELLVIIVLVVLLVFVASQITWPANYLWVRNILLVVIFVVVFWLLLRQIGFPTDARLVK